MHSTFRQTSSRSSEIALGGRFINAMGTDDQVPHAYNRPAAVDFGTPVTSTVHSKGKAIRIHAFSTGTVAVTRSFRTRKGKGLLSKLNVLLDTQFTEFMPIWVWVIEHPEGVVIVDTGENADVLQADYFDATGLFNTFLNRRTIRFAIDREQEIDVQLQKIGLSVQAVRSVVLTHLHLDHTDGLRHFRNTDILVNSQEWEHPYNNLPELYPAWFKPRLVDYIPEQNAFFGPGFPITDAGDLMLVPTPGHTHNHSSVLLHTDEGDILFAGDASYNQRQVIEGELAGVNADARLSRATYDTLLTYARQQPLIYLPSHDPEAAHRLVNRIPLV